MDAIIDRRFERVEKALATLINSIATYNPAPALANDLVAADSELSQSLEQLSTHQANYAKILSLRETSAALDAQIRKTLVLLTETRKELLATGSTSFSSNTNPVSYSELLTYARRISRFTQPPSRREWQAQQAGTGGEGATPRETVPETQTNGGSTPVTATNGTGGQVHMAMAIDNPTPAAAATQSQTQTSQTALPEYIKEFYNPLTGVQFLPWPSEDFIRSGALAGISLLVSKGIDPATFDPAKAAELDEDMKRAVEEEEQQQRENRMIQDRRAEAERRMSVAGPGMAVPRREEPKVFQLETFDDDEDD